MKFRDITFYFKSYAVAIGGSANDTKTAQLAMLIKGVNENYNITKETHINQGIYMKQSQDMLKLIFFVHYQYIWCSFFLYIYFFE